MIDGKAHDSDMTTTARRSTLTARIATIEMNLAATPNARHADIWRANLAAARRELGR